MVDWKIILGLGVLIGAVLVKESKKADQFYDSTRARIVASLNKLRARSKKNNTLSEEESGPSAAPASN
jgi:hypothetical protein